MLLEQCLKEARVLPVVTPGDVASTLSLAKCLFAAGMPAIEVTLRTASALDCLKAVKQELPDMIVAAGTITRVEDLHSAHAAGADLCLSPGISRGILDAAGELGMPLVPGVATASEVMLGLESGRSIFKLFPAATLGGLNMLGALAGPFPDVMFCPTGGLNPNNYRDFLAAPNVICCGGSWMVSSDLVEGGHWNSIERLAADTRR